MSTNSPMDEGAWRLCLAPMIDVTDRHCRMFHRMLAPQATLYTEMITIGALLHGDVARHLDYNAAEHPLALHDRTNAVYGTLVSVRSDFGCRTIIKQKTQ